MRFLFVCILSCIIVSINVGYISNVDNIIITQLTTAKYKMNSNYTHIYALPNNLESMTNGDPPPCLNIHQNCLLWASLGECHKNPNYMRIYCAKSCKTCPEQTIPFRERYCKNRFHLPEFCYKWMRDGECQNNIDFMRRECTKACQMCDYESRCEPTKYYNSSLNLMDIPHPNLYERLFYRLIKDKYLSWKYNISLLHFYPPIIMFHDFIPNIIVDKFLETNNFTYHRSSDAGELDTERFELTHIINEGRTSTNSWCDEQTCMKNNYSKVILNSIQQVLYDIPINHFEQLQVLNYDDGQQYQVHHDYIPTQRSLTTGPRILTLFVYLNDVDKGGETYFPLLNISVKPKKGTAILWPNVLSNNVLARQDLTHHGAAPPINCTKKGVNVWVHLYDFTKAWHKGCTG